MTMRLQKSITGVSKELYATIVEIIEDKVEGIKVQRTEFEELKQAVKELAEAQKRTKKEIAKIWEAIAELRQAVKELAEVQRQFARNFDYKMGALGSRWGLGSEESFRNGLVGILSEYGFEVIRYMKRDEEGIVFGYPENVEIDAVIKDGKILLIEIKSSITSISDIYTFERKVKFYSTKEGREVSKKVMISPFVLEKATSAAQKLGIKIYSSIEDFGKITTD